MSTELKKAFGLIEEGFTALHQALNAQPSSEATAETAEAPAKSKGKAKRRRRKKAGTKKAEAPASGPNIEDVRTVLLEVVEAFDDGRTVVEELLSEIEEGVIKISEMKPENYQIIIDTAKKYLADSEEDDD